MLVQARQGLQESIDEALAQPLGRPILELAQVIATYHGAPEPVIVGTFRDGDVRAASADTSAATSALEWAPTVGLVEGVARLQEWIAAQA